MPYYTTGCKLVINFVAKQKGRRVDVGQLLFDNGAEKPVFTVSSKDVTFSEPKVQVDTEKMMLRVAGEVEFTQNPQWDPISWLMGDKREAVKDVEAHMRYWPHEGEFPQMQVEALLPRRVRKEGEPSWATLPS